VGVHQPNLIVSDSSGGGVFLPPPFGTPVRVEVRQPPSAPAYTHPHKSSLWYKCLRHHICINPSVSWHLTIQGARVRYTLTLYYIRERLTCKYTCNPSLPLQRHWSGWMRGVERCRTRPRSLARRRLRSTLYMLATIPSTSALHSCKLVTCDIQFLFAQAENASPTRSGCK